MLAVRNAQLHTFRESAHVKFAAEMLLHLRTACPRVRQTPDDALAKTIHYGIAHARAHGFTLRGPVRLFLELMTIFGSEFYNDPQYEWASATLANPTGDREILVARRLYQQ